MYGSFTNKCFLSEVNWWSQSVKTKTGGKEINVCGFRQAAGQKESSGGGAGAGAHQGLHRSWGKPAASFLWLPQDLATVLLQPSHPMQQETISSVIKEGNSEKRESGEHPQETTLPLTYSHFLSPLSPSYLIRTEYIDRSPCSSSHPLSVHSSSCPRDPGKSIYFPA